MLNEILMPDVTNLDEAGAFILGFEDYTKGFTRPEFEDEKLTSAYQHGQLSAYEKEYDTQEMMNNE
jgi:hypothetical protein